MAQIRADEISRVLREEIKKYEAETGSVISVGDAIARMLVKTGGGRRVAINQHPTSNIQHPVSNIRF